MYKDINNTHAADFIDRSLITEATTLGELLSILGPVTKADKTPTARKLRGEPVAGAEGCTVYRNGYCVYNNGSGRTVMWLPACTSFTYFFDKLRDSERGGEIAEKGELPDGFLETQPWVIPVTLIGEHRIEACSVNRKSDRKGRKSYVRGDSEEGDALESHNERKDRMHDEYMWREDRFGENPEDAYLRKEQQEELLATLTEKQREVFVPYFRDGYTQKQVADMLGVDRTSVEDRLEGTVKKIRKFCGIPSKQSLPRL